MHYNRWKRHGDPNIRLKAHGSGTTNNGGYIMVRIDGRFKYEHIALAEKALGRPLPYGAKIHHMDENRSNNHTPFNLILCPSEEYHQLLHRRMKELKWLA